MYPQTYNKVNNVRRLTAMLCIVALCLVAPGEARCHEAESAVVETVSHPFQGVRHLVRTQSAPEPLAYHIVEIALDAPGIRFVTTAANGPDEPRDTWCETTRTFVARTGAQIGINANYFIYDQEHHTALLGLAVSEGSIVSRWDNGPYRFALNITRDNQAVFVKRPENGAGTPDTEPATELYNAVSGQPMLLRGGDIQVNESGDRHPRTGVGVSADNTLLLLIVDGRQPTRSVGMTFYEMAKALQAHGATDALALDGGGSTTLVFADPIPRVVNAPMPAALPLDITLGPPGIERMNGNNFAVFAMPLENGEANE